MKRPKKYNKYSTDEERTAARKKKFIGYNKKYQKKYLKNHYKLDEEDTLWRNTTIRELYAQGISVTKIHKRLQISRETVYKVIKEFFKA